ncbi:MAG: ATP synthase F1 subunit delta [Holosporales bacterium]|jgi:F-type H+-transporting ATPase subunit delta|nr:ATP synthase F1 subunit delta [Holosporales bacterium]
MCTSAAGRYALALFNVAKNNNSLERTLFECETVIEVLSKKSAYGSIFTRMLQGRFISINEFIKATKLQDFFVRFLQLLIKNNRMSLLKNIVRLFSHLVDNELNRESLIVYSAEEIAGSYKEKIMEKLSNSFKKNLRITYKINPNILGGLLIQSATITIDVSVRHQIDKFSKETLERLLFYGGKS